MRRFASGVLGAVSLAAVLALASTVAASDGNRDRDRHEVGNILEFQTMTPVIAPFTGTGHPIRGIGGGGVPWQIAAAHGELGSSGKLEVSVRGLVIVATGVNPVGTFVAAVNCLTTASPDTGVTLLTAPVAVGAAGNANFEAHLSLPSPCVAPIVFVGTPAGNSLRWFATTGN